MADKLNSLIAALENTDTYDKENALIELIQIVRTVQKQPNGGKD